MAGLNPTSTGQNMFSWKHDVLSRVSSNWPMTNSLKLLVQTSVFFFTIELFISLKSTVYFCKFIYSHLISSVCICTHMWRSSVRVKWSGCPEFKSWKRLLVFRFSLNLLFSFQLWENRRAGWVLSPWKTERKLTPNSKAVELHKKIDLLLHPARSRNVGLISTQYIYIYIYIYMKVTEKA